MTKAITKQCLKSNNSIFSQFNSHLLQLEESNAIMTFLQPYDIK